MSSRNFLNMKMLREKRKGGREERVWGRDRNRDDI